MQLFRQGPGLSALCAVHVQAFLGTAFAAEGLLFAFHLKGTPLDWSLHFLLVLLIFAAALVCFGEYRRAEKQMTFQLDLNVKVHAQTRLTIKCCFLFAIPALPRTFWC